ncbi:hypothetical protein PsYK624_063010 [Phanerochaete sordida]|uniref:Uncharacterized protein n=1 Tax=Phanerochaete sordida TaxID=48140 RepID=A0A9P3LCF0_9APHY|nr:hypothetical protein PsYK624_063010 [Phanerochaete sordida]
MYCCGGTWAKRNSYSVERSDWASNRILRQPRPHFRSLKQCYFGMLWQTIEGCILRPRRWKAGPHGFHFRERVLGRYLREEWIAACRNCDFDDDRRVKHSRHWKDSALVYAPPRDIVQPSRK